MQSDPTHEWQRLTRLYGEMGDEELLDLAAGFSDLTGLAQPILRDEMRKRGLADPQQPIAGLRQGSSDLAQIAHESGSGRILDPWGNTAPEETGEASPKVEDADEENAPHKYTWKTELCARDSWEEAWQIAEMLRRRGIESWPDRRGTSFGTRSTASQPVRILVAADQLDDANQIIAQPIPQDVIDQSKVKVEDFVAPTCPKCGAEDPLLESVEPANSWRCENCGAQWTDSSAFDPGSCTTS